MIIEFSNSSVKGKSFNSSTRNGFWRVSIRRASNIWRLVSLLDVFDTKMLRPRFRSCCSINSSDTYISFISLIAMKSRVLIAIRSYAAAGPRGRRLCRGLPLISNVTSHRSDRTRPGMPAGRTRPISKSVNWVSVLKGGSFLFSLSSKSGHGGRRSRFQTDFWDIQINFYVKPRNLEDADILSSWSCHTDPCLSPLTSCWRTSLL